MIKEKIKGVINNNTWERDGIEFKKSSIEEAINNYYNVSCEEIDIVAKTLSVVLMVPKIDGISIQFKLLNCVYKNTCEIIVEYNNSNLGFTPKEISIIDQNVLSDNGAIKIFNRFLYDLKSCSNAEYLQNADMFKNQFINYVKKYKEFPGTYLKLFRYVEVKIYDGKFIIYLSKHKKAIELLDELEE